MSDTLRGESWVKPVVRTLYIVSSLIFLYMSAFGSFSDMVQRALLITLLCPTIFLTVHLKFGKWSGIWTRGIDYLLALVFIASGTYIMVVWQNRILKVGSPPNTDIIFGTIMIICVLEATRRTTGKFLSVTAILFLLYTLYGRHLPGLLAHKGESWRRIVTFMYVSTEGIFGVPMGIAASYIILFVIFGAFLEAFGTGQWFVDISYAITGRYRGGPAKTAVLASGLMGMISGSSAANVVTTGSFTIPLMKRTGYQGYEAAAVEAVASSGGMFTPPIMGAGAFIMAEYIGIPYMEIALAATLPALLYYFSVIMSVDAIAVKSGLRGLPKDELPSVKSVMKERGIFVIPIICLVGFILLGFSPIKAAFYSIVAILIVASMKKVTRPTLHKIAEALESGSSSVLSIVATCATAGIIVGVLSMTGLGAKLSYSLISIANGNIYIGATIAAIITIILGCGMPPTAVYIILASVLAPPLIEMGIVPIAAHMFIFIFSCIGAITPPVAITAYTAAALADADPNKTGFRAFRLGIVAYLVPFIFITSPALIMVGNAEEIVLATVTAFIGVLSLVGAFEGCILRFSFSVPSRICLAIAALLTIIPGLVTDLIGIAFLIAAGGIAYIQKLKLQNCVRKLNKPS
ncbi:MAG: TRAP transporter fused permease subunit [Ruminococcaceae bacterium]|nr:TRAP transporter fused permease subunit [Oscillospiraceae bacterium]